MKKTILLMVCLMALTIGLNSCVDTDNTKSEGTYYGYVTVDAETGKMYPDLLANVVLNCGVEKMKSLGLDKYKRVYLIYKATNDDIDRSGDVMVVRPNILQGYGVQPKEISNRPDTLSEYNGMITYYNGYGSTMNNQFFTFLIPGMSYIYIYPGVYRSNEYLNLNYVAPAYTDAVLVCDSLDRSKHTAYMSFKVRNNSSYSDGGYSHCYNLNSCDSLTSLSADLTDSITVMLTTKAAMNESKNVRIRIPKSVIKQ